MSKPLNTDPFAIWNQPAYADNPSAAHNGIDSDNPFKPWNQPFGKIADLNDEDAATYGIERNTHGDDNHCVGEFVRDYGGDDDEDDDQEDDFIF